MRLLLRQGLRHHRRHPLQTLLTLLGIAVGVAMACAMQLSQGTAERAFDLALATVAGNATHTVTAGPEGLPVADCARLRAVLGGRGLAPVVTAVVRVPEREERTVLRMVGVDPFADAELRPWAAAGGGGDAAIPVAELVTVPGGFVAVPALLARLGLAAGSTVRVTVGGRPFVATCLGALRTAPVVAAGLEDTMVVDIATAQEWTGRLDRVDRIDLFLLPETLAVGRTTDDALATVTRILGPGARIVAAGAKEGGLAHLARGFRINVRALSLLALLVGAFLVHETMRLSVTARRRSFGVLRALGARGRSLGVVVGIEAALLGLGGSVLGVLLSVAFANVLLEPLVRTLNDHYATFVLHRVDVDPWVLASGIVLGTATALLAGLGPALAAARVPPREVLVAHRPPAATRLRRTLPWAVVPAVLATVLLATTGDRLVQGYLGTLAMLVAAMALVPAGLAALLGAMQRCVRSAGPFVRYVVRSTAAARDHLAMPVAAMVLAIAATVGLATLVGSFRDSVTGWLAQVLPADVYVTVPGGVDERVHARIAPEIVKALREAPGVEASTTYQRTRLSLRGGRGEDEIELVGLDPTPAVARGFVFLRGDEEEGRAAMVRGQTAWVSEPLAFRWGLEIGDPLTVAAARGPVVIPISGIYRDYSNERGEVIVGKVWFDAHVASGITAVSLHARPGQDEEALVADLQKRAGAAAEQDVSIRSQRDLRESSIAIFDRTFAITGVMRLLCLVVAFFGIYSAFAALQLERGAETGLLRCLGARPAQIGGVVLGQTAVLGLCAGLLAVPVGALLGHVLAHVINRVSFGWTLLSVSVPWSAMVQAVLLAVVAGTLAGVQPAIRFARMRPAAALREA